MKLKKGFMCFLVLMFSCFSTSSFAIFGGKGSSLKEILKLLKSIDSATGQHGTATLSEIEAKLQLIQQTKMQIEQLKMEAENFRQLGKELGHMDIAKINQLVDRTLGFKDYASMTTREMEKNLDAFFSDYDVNYKLLDKYDLELLKAQQKKLREQEEIQQKMVYNNMAKNQMYANINDQGEELKRKVNTLNNVAGTLQALQAIGGILEQTNTILLETKQMIATNMEIHDRAETKALKETEVRKDNEEAFQKEADKVWDDAKKEARKDAKKSNFTIEFKKK